MSDNKAAIIADRKAGMEIRAIAAKHRMDKMDVMHICKDIDRTGRKAAKPTPAKDK